MRELLCPFVFMQDTVRVSGQSVREGSVMNTADKKRKEKTGMEIPGKDRALSVKKGIICLSYMVGVLGSGALAAALAARINGMHLGVYAWPLMACVDLFVLSTTGFFLTGGKKEVLYGACSIASAACAIVQLALIF